MQPEEWNVRNHHARVEEEAVDYWYRMIGVVFMFAALAGVAILVSHRNGSTYLAVALDRVETDAVVTPCDATFNWCPLGYRFEDGEGARHWVRARYTLPDSNAGDTIRVAYAGFAPAFSAPVQKLEEFVLDGAILCASVVVVLMAAGSIARCLTRIRRLSLGQAP